MSKLIFSKLEILDKKKKNEKYNYNNKLYQTINQYMNMNPNILYFAILFEISSQKYCTRAFIMFELHFNVPNKFVNTFILIKLCFFKTHIFIFISFV